MKIAKAWPPNRAELESFFPLKGADPIFFAYGDILYNPSGVEVPPDIFHHEEVHQKQQERYVSPEYWWKYYLMDKAFRLDQELEAYGSQFNWVKKHYPAKAHKEALYEMAQNLASPLYKLGLGHLEAENLIRQEAKNVAALN